MEALKALENGHLWMERILRTMLKMSSEQCLGFYQSKQDSQETLPSLNREHLQHKMPLSESCIQNKPANQQKTQNNKSQPKAKASGFV